MDGRAEVVTLGYRMTSIPTVVVLTEDGTFLVGDPAERRATSSPERLAREFKRRVGDPTPLLLGGTPVSVDRLLAEVLGFVHRTVAQTEGGPSPPSATRGASTAAAPRLSIPAPYGALRNVRDRRRIVPFLGSRRTR